MSLYCFFVHNKAHPSAAACGLESFLSPTERSDEKTIRGTLVLCYWGPWLDELFQSQLLYIYKNTSSYLKWWCPISVLCARLYILLSKTVFIRVCLVYIQLFWKSCFATERLRHNNARWELKKVIDELWVYCFQVEIIAIDTMESVGEYEYAAKDLIGHGAFAVVFKGRHKKVRKWRIINAHPLLLPVISGKGGTDFRFLIHIP